MATSRPDFAQAGEDPQHFGLVASLGYIWDVPTLSWVKSTGGGGGGGAVTVADGADVAQGTTTDAAWVSGAGTVIGLLKTIASGGGSVVSVTSTVTPAGDDVVADGRNVVTTAGTRVQLSAQACKEVVITAETDNTGMIVVGSVTCVAAIATRRGVPLNAGDSATFAVDNVNRLYIDSTVSGEGVTWAILG
jgi:hypothetical protein